MEREDEPIPTYFVFGTYAGGNDYASLRGAYGNRRRAHREASRLQAEAGGQAANVIFGVTTSNHPRHPATGQRMTLYV